MSRLDDALAALRAQARPDQLEGMARFGMTGDGRLGLAVPTLRALAREFKRDHELALALWDTEIPDAQILAGMVAEPVKLTVQQMDHWVAGLQAWDVCDQACLNAFVKSPLAWDAIPRWAARQPEFERRAGFALLAVAAVHQKTRPDADFLARLPLIATAAGDERNFVKKAVNWALRQIGKRSAALCEPALTLARALAERDEKSARWIGNDARRELERRAS
ncbi:DNA alkylation repair protein [Roseateles asaccharophilus]|uniref:3-methyladenine DNA glycosylase AlkD n=2 Tax=Roseateles asaccharophilus TaxID=582607 RepID=A0ABU2AES5_9BURK|nr:DNA alkylation repair protein [Roseateles asaccharophilus]MDR7335716.1 3-methyladenine DNA glycosylase AlkD [Roseateles asaccharophilus]